MTLRQKLNRISLYYVDAILDIVYIYLCPFDSTQDFRSRLYSSYHSPYRIFLYDIGDATGRIVNIQVFRNITQCRQVNSGRRFTGGFPPPYLDFEYARNNFLHNSWKIEATRTSEKSVHFYQ